MKTKWLVWSAVIAAVCIASCKKDEAETARMTVKMTDAPAEFLSVNVEISAVEVNINGAWITLATNAGVYDLLELQNDVTAVIAPETEIPAGRINQMRLVLGSDHSVVTALGEFSLTVPSGSETGLKLNVNTTVQPDAEVEIVVDFDAGASVVLQGNGSFSLKPVLKLESVSQF